MFTNEDIEKFEYEEGFQHGEQARAVHAEFIETELLLFEQRKQTGQLPRIVPMFGGHGRSGKDEAAIALKEAGWRFETSMSQVCAPLIAKDRREPVEEAFRERHHHRHFWRGWYDGLRDFDPKILVCMTLARNDLLVGIRSKAELVACREADLFQMAIWVDRPGIPVDPTVEYTIADCDCLLPNYEDLESWHYRVVDFMTKIGGKSRPVGQVGGQETTDEQSSNHELCQR